MKFNKLIIELKPSMIDKGGIGVFSVTNIKKGQKVAEGLSLKDFKHQTKWVKFKYFDNKTKKIIMDFCVGTLEGFIPPENHDFNKLSIEWYFNHSCDGNLGFDKDGDFIAIRGIKIGEELSYDYGLIESNTKYKMNCKCRSKYCRKIITGDDWKIIIKDKNKIKYIHPFIVQISA